MQKRKDLSYIISKHHLNIQKQEKEEIIQEYQSATLKGRHIFSTFIASVLEKITLTKNTTFLQKVIEMANNPDFSMFKNQTTSEENVDNKPISIYPYSCLGDEQLEDENQCDICGKEWQHNQLYKDEHCEHSYCEQCAFTQLFSYETRGLKKQKCQINKCDNIINRQEIEMFFLKNQSTYQQIKDINFISNTSESLLNYYDLKLSLKASMNESQSFTCLQCHSYQRITQPMKNKDFIQCQKCQKYYCVIHQESLDYCTCDACPKCLSTMVKNQSVMKQCKKCDSKKMRNTIVVLNECLICLQNIYHLKYSSCCGQPFHEKCLESIRKTEDIQQCPYCRNNIIQLQDFPISEERAKTIVFESGMKESNPQIYEYDKENICSPNL